jgi:hypothetical protein
MEKICTMSLQVHLSKPFDYHRNIINSLGINFYLFAYYHTHTHELEHVLQITKFWRQACRLSYSFPLKALIPLPI